MAWLDWSFSRDEKDLAFYAKFQREKGRPHPHMLSRPVLTGHQESIWRIFGDIARSRLTDQGYRPLSDEDVMRWCARNQRSLAFADYLWWHIRRIDDQWLQLMAEKRQREIEIRQR